MKKILGKIIVILIIILAIIFLYKSFINFHSHAYSLSITELIAFFVMIYLGDEIASYFL